MNWMSFTCGALVGFGASILLASAGYLFLLTKLPKFFSEDK